MFELIIRLSRYLFIFYIAYFLWQGVRYIAYERGLMQGNAFLATSKQRIAVIFMHITAFLILAYEPGTFSFNYEALMFATGSLVLLIAMNVGVSRIYKGSCPLIWNGVYFLLTTGLIMLWRLDQNLASRQLIWFFVGAFAMFLVPLFLKLIPKFEKLEPLYLIAGLGLLCLPFLFGTPEYGALRSVNIGPLGFQPSEMVKFLFVFYLASAFRKNKGLLHVIMLCAVSAVYIGILVMQTDLGSALIFFMTFMVMMYVSTGSELLFFAGMGAASAASMVAYRLFWHVRVRVAIWQDPWADVHGIGHQVVQSLFAIATWGLLGSGLTLGMPQRVPVVARDMMFAAICEELGSLFGIGLIGVYIMIFYRGAHIALRCRRKYYSLLAVGFTAMMAFQTFLILGGTINLIPLSGVTMPFVSYGGSSVTVSLLMIGIVQWVFMYCSKEADEGEEGMEVEDMEIDDEADIDIAEQEVEEA